MSRGEAEIVDAEPLGSFLRAWIVKWHAERPFTTESNFNPHLSNGRNLKSISNGFIGPIQWLSQETGIHTRTVSGICNGEFPRVGLSKADALLTATGQNYLLGSEISVKKNPRWSDETWREYMAERGCI
jgi:hypothetical protein